MDQGRNARTGETGDRHENPPTSGIVWHDTHLRKSGRVTCDAPEMARLPSRPPVPSYLLQILAIRLAARHLTRVEYLRRGNLFSLPNLDDISSQGCQRRNGWEFLRGGKRANLEVTGAILRVRFSDQCLRESKSPRSMSKVKVIFIQYGRQYFRRGTGMIEHEQRRCSEPLTLWRQLPFFILLLIFGVTGFFYTAENQRSSIYRGETAAYFASSSRARQKNGVSSHQHQRPVTQALVVRFCGAARTLSARVHRPKGTTTPLTFFGRSRPLDLGPPWESFRTEILTLGKRQALLRRSGFLGILLFLVRIRYALVPVRVKRSWNWLKTIPVRVKRSWNWLKTIVSHWNDSRLQSAPVTSRPFKCETKLSGLPDHTCTYLSRTRAVIDEISYEIANHRNRLHRPVNGDNAADIGQCSPRAWTSTLKETSGSLSISIGCCPLEKAFLCFTGGRSEFVNISTGSYAIRVQNVKTCENLIQPIKLLAMFHCSYKLRTKSGNSARHILSEKLYRCLPSSGCALASERDEIRETRSSEAMRVNEVSMEQRCNEREGETGDPRENPLTSGIVRHDPLMRKSGNGPFLFPIRETEFSELPYCARAVLLSGIYFHKRERLSINRTTKQQHATRSTASLLQGEHYESCLPILRVTPVPLECINHVCVVTFGRSVRHALVDDLRRRLRQVVNVVTLCVSFPAVARHDAHNYLALQDEASRQLRREWRRSGLLASSTSREPTRVKRRESVCREKVKLLTMEGKQPYVLAYNISGTLPCMRPVKLITMEGKQQYVLAYNISGTLPCMRPVKLITMEGKQPYVLAYNISGTLPCMRPVKLITMEGKRPFVLAYNISGKLPCMRPVKLITVEGKRQYVLAYNISGTLPCMRPVKLITMEGKRPYVLAYNISGTLPCMRPVKLITMEGKQPYVLAYNISGTLPCMRPVKLITMEGKQPYVLAYNISGTLPCMRPVKLITMEGKQPYVLAYNISGKLPCMRPVKLITVEGKRQYVLAYNISGTLPCMRPVKLKTMEGKQPYVLAYNISGKLPCMRPVKLITMEGKRPYVLAYNISGTLPCMRPVKLITMEGKRPYVLAYSISGTLPCMRPVKLITMEGKQPYVLAYNISGTLPCMRPVKLITMEGKRPHVLAYNISGKLPCMRPVKLITMEGKQPYVLAYNISGTLPCMRPVKLITMEGKQPYVLAYNISGTLPCMRPVKLITMEGKQPYVLAYNISGTLPCMRPVKLITMEGKQLYVLAYNISGTLPCMRPVKLITMEGKQPYVLAYNISGTLPCMRPVKLITMEGKQPYVLAYNISGTLPCMRPVKLITMEGKQPYVLAYNISGTLPCMRPVKLITVEGKQPYVLAYNISGTLPCMRPVKLITMEGKQPYVLAYNISGTLPCMRPVKLITMEGKQPYVLAYNISGTLPCMRPVKLITMEGKRPYVLAYNISGTLPCMRPVKLITMEGKRPYVLAYNTSGTLPCMRPVKLITMEGKRPYVLAYNISGTLPCMCPVKLITMEGKQPYVLAYNISGTLPCMRPVKLITMEGKRPYVLAYNISGTLPCMRPVKLITMEGKRPYVLAYNISGTLPCMRPVKLITMEGKRPYVLAYNISGTLPCMRPVKLITMEGKQPYVLAYNISGTLPCMRPVKLITMEGKQPYVLAYNISGTLPCMRPVKLITVEGKQPYVLAYNISGTLPCMRPVKLITMEGKRPYVLAYNISGTLPCMRPVKLITMEGKRPYVLAYNISGTLPCMRPVKLITMEGKRPYVLAYNISGTLPCMRPVKLITMEGKRPYVLAYNISGTLPCMRPLGEPGSVPRGFVLGFSHVGIVPDDAAGRRIFSGISRFTPPFHSGAAPNSLGFTLIGSQDLAVKSRPDPFTRVLHGVRGTDCMRNALYHVTVPARARFCLFVLKKYCGERCRRPGVHPHRRRRRLPQGHGWTAGGANCSNVPTPIRLASDTRRMKRFLTLLCDADTTSARLDLTSLYGVCRNITTSARVKHAYFPITMQPATSNTTSIVAELDVRVDSLSSVQQAVHGRCYVSNALRSSHFSKNAHLRKCLYHTDPFPRAPAKWRALNDVRPYTAVCAEIWMILLASHQGNPGSIPGRVTPDFCMWESCRTMPLVGGSPVSPALSFGRCSILTLTTSFGSQDLAVKEPPKSPIVGGNPENRVITKSGVRIWHCSSESIVYIQNSITPLDYQRIKENVTLSEDCEASRAAVVRGNDIGIGERKSPHKINLAPQIAAHTNPSAPQSVPHTPSAPHTCIPIPSSPILLHNKLYWSYLHLRSDAVTPLSTPSHNYTTTPSPYHPTLMRLTPSSHVSMYLEYTVKLIVELSEEPTKELTEELSQELTEELSES
ncbi:hypothetical protein PR048_023788 [Dryococelus australis]|uniref:Uncharacterized protein n=1 Tax=Dryococelus australis TaxID=614101 RepID=A0ABQ9GV00_9NEOP|nr:hypothetical protein PR048_023788 [Dryococelus australis]